MAMVKNPFNGNLNSNEIFSSIYNMIISQQIFADNIKGGAGLVELFRTDGSLNGDTKLFYSTDALRGQKWTNDSESANLLDVDRPIDPKCQAVTLDQFTQIRVTLDNYMTKRAWGDEGAFSNFNTIMLGWLGKTKQVFDNTLINTYVGTVATSSTINSKKIVLTASPATVDAYKLRGMLISKGLADLMVDMGDYSRDYNTYSFLRNYDASDLVVIWNAKYVNEISYVDAPAIYHDGTLKEKFTKYVLPERYFGTVGAAAVAAANITASTYRSTIEADYVTATTSGSTVYHLMPGDYIPAGGMKLTAGKVIKNGSSGWKLSGAGTASTGIAVGEYYTPSTDVICKVVHKDSIKYMSAFQVASEFWNPRALNNNHYLTFGYSTPDYLREFPIIKVYEAAS